MIALTRSTVLLLLGEKAGFWYYGERLCDKRHDAANTTWQRWELWIRSPLLFYHLERQQSEAVDDTTDKMAISFLKI